jgi:hypothetical protein
LLCFTATYSEPLHKSTKNACYNLNVKNTSLLGLALDLYGDPSKQQKQSSRTRDDWARLNKAQFFARLKRKTSLTDTEITHYLQAAGFTGYTSNQASALAQVVKQAINGKGGSS